MYASSDTLIKVNFEHKSNNSALFPINDGLTIRVG